MLWLPSSDINSSHPKTQLSALRAGDLQCWLEGTLRWSGQWLGSTMCCPLASWYKAGSAQL